MADSDSVPGPSGLKKKRLATKVYSDQELLQVLEDSDSDFDDVQLSEDDGWESSESEKSNSSENSQEESDQPTNVLDNIDIQTPNIIIDANIIWHNDPSDMKAIPFTKNESLLIRPNGNKPIDFFRLIVTNEFLQEIVDQTNYNAEQIFLSKETKEKSRICSWKYVTVEEILIFLGVFLHTGNVKMSKLQNYWKKDPLFYNKAIATSISRNRFLVILRSLHFATDPEPGQPKPNDRLYKIRPVIDFFNRKMSELYYPGRELSLDESMVLWRGRLIFRQYIKNKKHKYGIKLYMLTTPKGLIQKFAVYTGMLDDFGGKAHAQRVVLHLLEGKLNAGHHLYMDNYYNSFVLAKILLENGTNCTGTLRLDRKGVPQDVKNEKLKKGETVARYADGVMIGKWRDKRDVSYISTEFENEMEEIENKRQQKVLKPKPIINYNKFMSGVDRQDQMLSYYLSERKTIRWPKKLFFHILEMCLLNAHHLFNKYSDNKMPLADFRLQVIKQLLPHIEEEHPRKNEQQQQHTLVKREATPGKKQVMRKRCKLCSAEGRRTDTIYECETCVGTPGFCLNCSIIYHK